jgi:hypothetical protein
MTPGRPFRAYHPLPRIDSMLTTSAQHPTLTSAAAWRRDPDGVAASPASPRGGSILTASPHGGSIPTASPHRPASPHGGSIPASSRFSDVGVVPDAIPTIRTSETAYIARLDAHAPDGR